MKNKGFLKEFYQRFLQTIKVRFYFALLAFVLLWLGFYLYHIPYPWLVALGISFLDFLPALGAGIAMVPWAGYHYLQGHTTLALKLFLLYLIVFLGLRLLEPIFIGSTTGLHPIITFLISIISLLLFGFWGILVGPVFIVFFGLIKERNKFQQKKNLSERLDKK